MERVSLSSGEEVSLKDGTARWVEGVLLKDLEDVVDDMEKDDARWMRRAQRWQMDGDAMFGVGYERNWDFCSGREVKVHSGVLAALGSCLFLDNLNHLPHLWLFCIA